jgi:hypothetical protein
LPEPEDCPLSAWIKSDFFKEIAIFRGVRPEQFVSALAVAATASK